MRLPGLIFFIFFVCVKTVFGQTNQCHKSTEGKDFWLGFMENRIYQRPQFPLYLSEVHYTEITLTSIYDCNYQIFIGKSVIPSFTGTISANTPKKIKIDWHVVEAIGSENIENKAIHLVSLDNPFNVYALNWCENSSDVALIFPKESLGNEYYTMCYTPHIHGNGINSGNGRNSEFLIDDHE